MGRNTGGVYTLPGAAFVSGTVISSSAMNAQLADIAAALTDSLSRSGDGDMTAELRVPDGSAALPTLSWTSDPGTGFYLAATSSFRAVILAATVQEWTSTAVRIQKPLTVTAAATMSSTLAVTGTTTLTGVLTANGGTTASTTVANGTALTATGNGTGTAIAATGGAPTSGNGGIGVLGTGGQPSAGGGNGGTGVRGVGGAPDTGGTYGYGGVFSPGVTSTASTQTNAIVLSGGNLAFSAANPNSTVPHTDTLTPANIPKAWAHVTTDGAGAITLDDGFNIASVAIAGGLIRINFATAFASANYAVTAISNQSGEVMSLYTSTTTSARADVEGYNTIGAALTDYATAARTVTLTFFGKQ